MYLGVFFCISLVLDASCSHLFRPLWQWGGLHRDRVARTSKPAAVDEKSVLISMTVLLNLGWSALEIWKSHVTVVSCVWASSWSEAIACFWRFHYDQPFWPCLQTVLMQLAFPQHSPEVFDDTYKSCTPTITAVLWHWGVLKFGKGAMCLSLLPVPVLTSVGH